MIESLEEKVSRLDSAAQRLKQEHAAELQRLQDMLLKKDGYISSIKEEQYRQEREIAQLEEVVFEKKHTRQKVIYCSCSLSNCDYNGRRKYSFC